MSLLSKYWPRSAHASLHSSSIGRAPGRRAKSTQIQAALRRRPRVAVIEPTADLNQLDELFIVLGPKGKGEVKPSPGSSPDNGATSPPDTGQNPDMGQSPDAGSTPTANPAQETTPTATPAPVPDSGAGSDSTPAKANP